MNDSQINFLHGNQSLCGHAQNADQISTWQNPYEWIACNAISLNSLSTNSLGGLALTGLTK